MKRGGHCCVDQPELSLSVVLMEGIEQQVACEDMRIA
jgi:hypothetical protein